MAVTLSLCAPKCTAACMSFETYEWDSKSGFMSARGGIAKLGKLPNN